MAAKKRGLGRGLTALLADTGSVTTAEEKNQSNEEKGRQLLSLPIEFLQRGEYQPRKEMNAEALAELAESIKAQGIIQPIVAQKLGKQSYEIIAGERRWRAAQLAELSEVPVVVQECGNESRALMALIENVQREDLSPLEISQALHRLADEFSMTHQQLAETVGRSRSAVSNFMRLLDLEEPVKALLEKGRLEMGHARALLGLSGAEQIKAAENIAQKGLSVREAERLVKQAGVEKRRPSHPVNDPDVVELERRLSEKLGAAIKLRHSANGKGQLLIRYNSLDELDGIIEQIC